MFSVVVTTNDVVGERMAGPGIRAFYLTRELSKHLGGQVFLSSFSTPGRKRRKKDLTPEVLIGQPGRGMGRHRKGQKLVFDLFDPILLELREMYRHGATLRDRIHYAAESWRLRRALADGDLIVCATPAQRELYAAARCPIIEVPFGIDPDEIAPAEEREDVVVWGGGTWEWLDPRTAVDAIVRLNHEGVECRLLFLGRNRPNRRASDRIDELLAGGHPFVMANDEWVPYRERLSWLRRAKIAMMLHRPTPEARYSIRTRLFDAIVTATPVVATVEGFAADLVAREGLGIVVPPSDANAVAVAVRRLLQDDGFYRTCVSNLERIRPRFAWSVVTRPLIEAVSEWQKQS